MEMLTSKEIRHIQRKWFKSFFCLCRCVLSCCSGVRTKKTMWVYMHVNMSMERKRLRFIPTTPFYKYTQIALVLIQMMVDGVLNRISWFLMVGFCLKRRFKAKI